MPSYASEDILEPLPQDIVDMVNPNFILKNKQGQPVAVSRWGNIFMLFYNKDLLQQAGVDPNISIKTWDDWKKVSDQITSKGNGKIFGGGVPSHPHAGGALRAVPFIRQLGADFGGGSAATINTPEMIKALTFIREMDKNFPKGIGNNPDEGPLYSMFEKDKALAFVVNGTWQESGCVNAGMKNYSAVSLPMAEGGKVSNCLVGFDYYGVPKASKHKDEAFEVIRMMLNKDLQKLMDNIPANKEILADPNYAKEFPSKAEAAKELLNGSFSGLVVFDKNNSQIWDVINNKVIARVTMTNDPIDKIVAEGQAEVEKLLK
jgi:multiple sugar transport system substrate-binding protein